MHKVVKAPAKINLTLDVLRKREDGYHDVEMVMTTVDLADRIHLTLLADDEIRVEVNKGHVPANKNNLAYQAARLLKDRYPVKGGVSIYIDKHIPVSAGLAGGSTDAAAVLRGLNDMWSLGLSLEELADIGLEIGSDVPYCVFGGTAVARGRGEDLTFISSPPPCWVVLAKPPAGVSTKDIYQRLNLDQMNHPDTEAMIQAIETQNFKEICNNLENVMEPATFELAPEVKKIKQRLIQFGAEGTVMSGSGPTVFSLAKTESKAYRLYNGLKGFMDGVFVVRLLGHRHE
ncbi:4-(cytidine 5'-diphospho)-2-C-methyl-D-erythritol kinase [Salipaludibacillus sp. CUR1]|uniref:4-(cytidine 5'-diphospho)-2-C-methyl-D-erythritol kinase n=1 Tax=Salipaludibacillus sp. CUR1 TaxID=2820003 RepID=UPI001E282F40|nr:4-(cytidine 5'-diphospho)-2-C-methyl-D-erythritol kinase [Salipaludibacillus sp. CUR1]MCE7791811.1 4-(cytidine 5'-diphospho)-2-C-methyl-D-erythritol kinase [Salipaludibacillus sp. CUR1]